MADPPSYDEITSKSTHDFSSVDTDVKVPQRFSIKEEVGTGRSQRVASLVSKVLPHVRHHAQEGVSKSTWLLLPGEQDRKPQGQLVGVHLDEMPTIIVLEDPEGSLKFWCQDQALLELQSQLLFALSHGLSHGTASEEPVEPLIISKSSAAAAKTSFWSRKQTKAPTAKIEAHGRRHPVTVDVVLDEASFRSETEAGLFETSRHKCVLVTVDVR